ncbi:MAG: hypothetical protein K9L32_00145 [Chromatiaceae bacterium]|nr:hypothetical protein [Chromatiaceae bacterium]
MLACPNGAAYLPAQLESLRAQRYPHWRLRASDDGSSDATPANQALLVQLRRACGLDLGGGW